MLCFQVFLLVHACTIRTRASEWLVIFLLSKKRLDSSSMMLETMPVKANCPFCKSEAETLERDYGNLTYFECPSCKCFLINRSALRILESTPEDQLKMFSDLSKSLTDDKVLRIDGDGATGSVNGKSILRSDLPK